MNGFAVSKEGDRSGSADTAGFSLVELIITIVIFGFIAYSFSMMQSHIVHQSVREKLLTKSFLLAEEKMEESIAEGVNVQPVDWTSEGGVEWRRSVSILQEQSGAPTLVEIWIDIRKDGKILCSLFTHVAE